MLRQTETASYSDFCEDTESHLSRLRKSNRPTYIVRRGKTELVILTAKQFELYAEDREYRETVRAVEVSRKQFDAGLGRPWSQVKKELRKKLKVAKPRVSSKKVK